MPQCQLLVCANGKLSISGKSPPRGREVSLLVLLPRSKGIIRNISVRWASNPVIHIHEYLNGIQLLLGKDCEVDQIGKWEIRLDRITKACVQMSILPIQINSRIRYYPYAIWITTIANKLPAALDCAEIAFHISSPLKNRINLTSG